MKTAVTLRQFARIVEIRTKIVSVSTYIGAIFFVWYRTGEVNLLRFWVMLAAVLMVDMGTTAFNSFFDYYRGVDKSDHGREADKVLLYEGVAPGWALLVSLGLFGGAGILGLYLGWLAGWGVVAAGAVSMAVGYLYTGGPHPISRTPFGELFAGGFLGTVLFLITWFVQTETLTLTPFLASLPSFFFIASILTVNNTCDIEGDKAAGRKTFSIVFGKTAGEALVYIAGALGFGLAGYLSFSGVFPLWVALLTLPAAAAAFFVYRKMHNQGYSHRTKPGSMGSISQVFMLFTLVFWAGHLLGILFPLG